MNYEDFENTIGFELPNKIKYIDHSGPPRTHWAFLRNDRTKKLLAYGEEKRIHRPGIEKVRNKLHAEQELLANIERTKSKLTTSEWRGPKTIISVRFSRCGFVGNSKFCSSCAKLIFKKCNAFVSNIMYFENENLCRESIQDICNNTTHSSSMMFRKGLSIMTS